MKLKKWIGLLLAGFMMTIGLTGCLGHVFTKAMTIDGEEISAGVYLMAQMVAYNEAGGKVQESGDPETDLFKQKVEDEDPVVWIRNRTEELCRRLVAIERIAAQKGVTLTEENLEVLESSMATFDTSEANYATLGIGKDTYRRFLTSELLGQQLFEVLYHEGGELAPTREELAAYMVAEKQTHVRLLYFNLADPLKSDPNDPENITEIENAAEVRTAIEAMLQEMKDGKTIQDAALENYPAIMKLIIPDQPEEEAAEQTPAEEEAAEETAPVEEAAEEPAEETTEETTEEPAEEEAPAEVEGIYNMYITYDPAAIPLFTAEFLDKLKTQKTGDVDIFENKGSIVVYQVIEPFETDKEYEDAREALVNEMKKEDFDAYLKGIYSAYTVEKVFGAEWYLNPKKNREPQK